MGEASDKHDEQCANLKKAAAICEQRGQGLVDSVIALQAKVDELTGEVNGLKHNAAVISDSLEIAIEFCEASAALKQDGE